MKSKMTVAYLINQYPKTSHSFIRREILALEQLGITVYRFSIRKSSLDSLVDSSDIAELRNTITLLDQGWVALFYAFLQCFTSSPITCVSSMLTSFQLGLHSKRGVLRHIFYLLEACLLKKELTKINVTHLHTHFGTNSATVALLCKLLGGPDYSFTVHGPEEFDDPKGLSLSKKIENSSFIIAISSYGKSQLMRHCSYEYWEKLKVVHCSVDNSFLEEHDRPIPIAPRLVCVGRLCEQKGQLLLIDALYLLKEKRIAFKMILAGDGEMRPEIEQAIQMYGLSDYVSITGWLSGQQVKDEIIKSRALVLPSFAEGLPVVIMEAFALKRPVLSTYIAGIPELVQNGQNGWLVPAGDVYALSLNLEKILSESPKRLLEMGRLGAQIVQQEHCDTIEAAKLINLFEQASERV